MNITIVVEGDAWDNLVKVTEMWNKQQRTFNAQWIDMTPEAYWQDYNTRWLEGLQVPVLAEEAQRVAVEAANTAAQAKAVGPAWVARKPVL